MKVFWFAAALCAALANAQAAPAVFDYLNQPLPGEQPEVFARGLISTDHHEHSAPAFSPDGNEVYWSHWPRPDKGDPQVIMAVRRVNGVWSAPHVASFSGKYTDGGPVFTADGKRLYFHSSRPNAAGVVADDIWFIEKTRGVWGEPHCLRLAGSLPAIQSVYQPVPTRNGTLYFTAHPPTTRDEYVIYRAAFVGGKYAKPEALPPSINMPGDFVNWTPFIAPDESYLIFSSGRRNRAGDLWISGRAADGSWSEPEILPASINTPEQERFPMLSPDGKYLFFTRPTEGHWHDVYWVSVTAVPALEAAIRAAEPSGN